MSETTTPQPPQVPSNRLGFLLLAAIAIVLLALQFSRTSNSGVDHALAGRPLGHLALEPLSEGLKPLGVEGLKGKVTLINFWGTWCGPCQVELPHLIQIHRQFRDRPDFQFLSVTVPYDPQTPRQDLRRMTAERLDQLGADFGFYEDARGETMTHLTMLSDQLGLGIPTTLIVDREGIIRGMWVGFSRGSEREMESLVRSTLDV